MAPQRPLSVRSGNQAAGSGMVRGKKPPPQRWAYTRAALVQLQEQLLCSFCVCILEEPVCLGGCDHVFCRKCVGTCVGSECPVCHTPAWVKDVQINRQLANMIQLCNKLHDVLDSGEKPTEKKRVLTSVKPSHAWESDSKKKPIRMWFSPRSRKVKCVLDKVPKRKQQLTVNGGAIYQAACSTFAFLPSPPSEEPPNQQKKQASKRKKSKKKQLEDINKEWGIGKKHQRGDHGTNKQSKDGDVHTHEERIVSFCSQPVVFCSPEPSPVEASLELGPVTESSPVRNGSVCHLELAIQVNPLEMCTKRESADAVGKEDFPAGGVASSDNKTKRGRQQLRSPIPTSPASKRPRRGKLSIDADLHGSSPDPSPSRSPERISQRNKHTTVVQISSYADEFPARPPPLKAMIPGEAKDLESPRVCKPAIACPGTPVSSVRSRAGTGCLSPSGISLGAKRNHKGETLLHIASIKGDLSSVEHLLKNGADPNVKDHAGWTPLHEACSHGHEKVVELLLQHRALVNTTGYQNDSPLHDAAKNGHVSIVQLLLGHGASRDAVNIFGLRPVDYAETEEMKSALLPPPGNKESRSACPSPALASPSQQREGHVVLMGSCLSSLQQKRLTKLCGILKARRCADFNSAVTHVVMPDGAVLSTMKGMLGILAGCWVLTAQWVEACLETKSREQEETYEIPGGPQRGRLNREHLLPKLLDGCYFFFLGSFRNHRKEDLAELVKAAGGQVLARQPKPDSDVTQTINTVAYHAEAGSDQSFCTQYVIYDQESSYRPQRIRQGKVWTAPCSWLIDCITSFQLLPVSSDCVHIKAEETM